jgi:NAD+ kinase
MKGNEGHRHRKPDSKYRRVGLVYNGKLDAARDYASEVEGLVSYQGADVWRRPSSAEEEIKALAADTDLVITVGGDGTLLRTARLVAQMGIPILSINLGRVGFTTELATDEVAEKLPLALAGEGWTDTRSMLAAERLSDGQRFQALNDVVISRGTVSRLIRLEARIEGELLATYRADGLVMATATGSTGYSLAAGGPVLHPQSRDIILQPICPHLSFAHCMVLPSDAIIAIQVSTDHQAVLSIDGQIDIPVADSEQVTVHASETQARLLRLHPPSSYYASLARRL